MRFCLYENDRCKLPTFIATRMNVLRVQSAANTSKQFSQKRRKIYCLSLTTLSVIIKANIKLDFIWKLVICCNFMIQFICVRCNYLRKIQVYR